ncbi:MAG TPA: protein kinase, partial [Roseiflexaceae bacterium]|nr:protein kinase [Roseiflexaceae bacterium]
IATEYIEGQTLRAVLKAGGLTIGEVLDAITQVGKALEAAHKAGIIHRDIKPENLMRREDGYVKVLDFGLAKLTESQNSSSSSAGAAFSHFTTRPGVVMGTVTYMSPEQARGDEVDARSDIFSLGVVLYEMLTGRVPFDGRTTSDVIAALLEREPQPLESHISGLPQQFQQIIARALAKPVEQRYPTMADMLADLHKLKQDLELASNLKKYGKTKSAEQSLLDLRVGQARSRDEVAHRATRGASGRRTSPLGRTGQWVKTHRGLALTGLLGLVVISVIFSQWYAGKWEFGFGDFNAIDSVAVMPFADEVNDAQLNYVPDGLTESLIHSLANLPRLRVMASGSVFTYKGRAINPLQIGKELNVSAIVSGRVQKRGQQLLISVELADARDGAHLWGAQYERPLAELLLVQAEIVRELTQQMRLRLSGAQQQQLARHQPANNEAYQHYLKGRFLFEFAQPTRETLEKALDYFQQAIAADPTYALAYTGMADLYVSFASQQLSPIEAMAKAKAAAQRARELDPTLAEAHNSMAGIHWLAEWDFPAAEAAFKRALELNPNAAAAATDYAQFLLHMKRLDEAQRMAARAQTLNPLSPHGSMMMAYALAGQRRYDAAIEQCRKTLELNPQDLFAHSLMSQFQ